MDPVVKLVKNVIEKIPDEEFSKLKSVTGMVVLIVKIIEESHRKKNLGYDDSKKLVSLVVDTLIHTVKNKNVPSEVTSTVSYLEENKDEVMEYVNESIHIWDALVPLFQNCCGVLRKEKKAKRRIKKSVV